MSKFLELKKMYNVILFLLFDYDIDKFIVGLCWEKWFRKFEILFVGMNLKDENCKWVLFLYYVGDVVYDIYKVEKGDFVDIYEVIK